MTAPEAHEYPSGYSYISVYVLFLLFTVFMINFIEYSDKMYLKGAQLGVPKESIERLLIYAKYLNDRNLPIIYEQEHLALLCGKSYEYLLGVSNHQEGYYRQYYLPKKSGGTRLIMEPLPSLKETQEWILNNILYRVIINSVAKNAKAFIPNIGIRENVRFHRNKDIVVNLDITDFFGSIKFKDVLDFFLSLGYTKAVSVFLANICICGDRLPQGAPTSPMLSNMIFKKYDDAIFSYCRNNRILFTRYADDMTFSGSFNVSGLLFFIESLFKDTNFRINRKKTKIYHRTSRQIVTNIVVNEKLQLPREYRKKIRQEVYYILKFGIESHLLKTSNQDIDPTSYIMKLRGKVNYCLQVNPGDTKMKELRKSLYGIYTSLNSCDSGIRSR